MLRNPKINRIIGYVVMFAGFFFFWKGFHTSGGNTDWITAGIGLLLVAAAVVWMIIKVRCPHCGGLLNLKPGNIDVCPHCGGNTNDTDR